MAYIGQLKRKKERSELVHLGGPIKEKPSRWGTEVSPWFAFVLVLIAAMLAVKIGLSERKPTPLMAESVSVPVALAPEEQAEVEHKIGLVAFYVSQGWWGGASEEAENIAKIYKDHGDRNQYIFWEDRAIHYGFLSQKHGQ